MPDLSPTGAAAPRPEAIADLVGEWQRLASLVAQAAVAPSATGELVYRLRAEAALAARTVERLTYPHLPPFT